jgi:hypothetical protein
MELKPRQKIYLLVLVAGILTLLVFIAYRIIHQPYPPTRADFISQRKRQAEMTFSGLTYTDSYKGNVVFSMEVGSLMLSKKKIGFFRIGGLRQLELKNVVADYHEPATATGDGVVEGEKGRNEERQGDLHSYLFSAGQSFLRSGSGRLAGLEVRNIRLRYHHADNSLSELQADLLDLKWNDLALRLQGNAQVLHNDRRLSSEEIFFQTKEKIIFTKDNYVLTTGATSHRGKAIRTDLRLREVPTETKANH